jgi:hypothetical protein
MIVSVLMLAACHSDYRSRFELPTDCERRLFYEDLDGDGWGTGAEGTLLCEADTERNLTSRNNLDCDDENSGVTGRISSLCPAQFSVPSAQEPAAYDGSLIAGQEIAVSLPTVDFSHVGTPNPQVTPTTWSDGAASACSPTGWGGALATFNNLAELNELTTWLDGVVGDSGYYAAWVGFEAVPGEATWKWSDKAVGEGLALNEVGYCDPGRHPDPSDARQAGLRLALVKRPGDDWCFGFPSDANPDALGEDEFAYGERDAHFICERTPPLPADYTVPRYEEE